MKITISNRWNGSLIFKTDANSLGATVLAAIKVSANLRGADLSGADLRGADLRSVNLSGADLRGADLSGADLRSVNLSGANLRGADLRGADLRGADLRSVNLSGADLSGANLRSVNLSGADLLKILEVRTILPDGDLIGWKKLQGNVICKLRIPATAKRVGGLLGRKCRAEFAVVMEGSGKAIHNGLEYKPKKKMVPDKYDQNPLVECSHGIHFYITKQEAIDCQ